MKSWVVALGAIQAPARLPRVITPVLLIAYSAHRITNPLPTATRIANLATRVIKVSVGVPLLAEHGPYVTSPATRISYAVTPSAT